MIRKRRSRLRIDNFDMIQSHETAFNIVSLFLYRLFYFSILAVLLGITAQALIPIYGPLIFLLFYMLVFLTCITVHELGHLTFALGAKLRVSMFAVGMLRLVRQKDRWKIRLNRNLLLGGFTLAAPLDEEHLDIRLILWTLGGPLVGILYGCACIILYLRLSPELVEPTGFLSDHSFVLLQAWLIANSVFSLMISLHSLVPDQNWTSTSDGYKLIQYFRKGGQADTLKYVYLLSGLAQAGIRPRDWRVDHLDYLINAPDLPGRRLQSFLLHYFYSLDSGKVDQAGRSLDQALMISKGEKLQNASLYWEAAYYTARYRHQPELARRWMKIAQPGFLDEEHTQCRADAAILIEEGFYQQSLALIEKGLKTIDQSIEPGIALAEREWMEELKAYALEREASNIGQSSAQTQIERLAIEHSVTRPARLRDFASGSQSWKPKFLKKYSKPHIRIDSLVKFLLLRIVPIFVFCVILAVLYYWLYPPVCDPMILKNLSCKSQYNLAVIQGLNFERQGLYPDARIAFSTALEAHPEAIFARRMRAELDSFSGNYQQAYDDYSLILAQSPEDAWILMNRAQVLMKQGKISMAIDDVLAAITVGGEEMHADGIRLLRQLYMGMDDIESFIDHVNSDTDAPASSGKKACKLGLAYAYQRDWQMIDQMLSAFDHIDDNDFDWCRSEIEQLSSIR